MKKPEEYRTGFFFTLLIIAVFSPSAFAQQNLTWDVNGATAGTGGTGAWNTTSTFWNNGVTFQAWNNAALDNAIFAGASGNVTLGTPITVHNMTFDTGGYLFPTSGALTFGGINPTITTNAGMTQFFSPMTGSTGFTKSGAGALQISGTSAGYTGVTTVDEGTLAVTNTLALGFSTAASNLVLNNGATFSLSTPPFAHNYTVTGGTANLQVFLSTVWSGSPTLTASTTLNLNGANASGTLSGNFADTGANVLSITRNSIGTVKLSGNNSYTGATLITQGALQLESANALSANSNLVFNGASGAGGTLVITAASGSFTRSLGAGAGQVRWVGDGGFRSSGSNSTVNLGGAGAMLTWGAGNFVPDGGRLVLGTASNNTLNFQNGIDLSGGVRAVQGDGGLITGHATMSGVLSGTGGINQVGNGFLELSGVNTYMGGTVLTSGTLLVGSDANLGDAAGNITFGGGTLQNTKVFTTGRSVTINAGGGTFLTNVDLVASGTITGAGHLTKTGTASLILTNADNHAGGTTIGAGTLQIGNGGTSGSIAGDIINNGILAFNRSDTAIFADVISGTGSLNQRGTGTTVLSGANLYTGNTTISAGTLQVGDGGMTGSILGNVTDNGTLAFNRSDAITFGGLVAGMGRLEQRGANTLTLTGINAYTGGTVLTSGVISVGVDGNLGGPSGPLIFNGGMLQNTGAFSTGRHVIVNASGGTFQTDADLLVSESIDGAGTLTKQGAATLTLTADNAYAGETIIGAGTLQIGNAGTSGSIPGDVTDNGVLAFNRSDALTYGGLIAGTGDLIQRGSGILTLTGSSAAFAGSTSIADGRLIVNGTLGGTLDVLSGGWLQGTGTVGTTDVASGGTLAAGDPFGTLTIDGNADFAAGSTFEMKTDSDGTMNLLHITGTATISGGTVNVVTDSGAFRSGARYTLLTADAARIGQFSALTETFPLLDMELAYDLNHVYLDVARNSTTLCSLAVTENQCATSSADTSLGSSSLLVEAVRSLPDLTSIERALDLLSGEVYASVKTAQLENSRYVREAVTDRVRQSFEENALSGPQHAAWGHIFDSAGHRDGNGNAASTAASVKGFLTGGDAAITEAVRIGMAVGYSASSFDVDSRASSASSDDYHLSMYGGGKWGPLGLRLGTAYTGHDIQAKRRVIFSGFSDTERADYTAHTAQIFGEAGYTFLLDALALEPYAGLARVHLSTGGFRETGGQAALYAPGDNESVTYSTLGLHMAQIASSDERALAARGAVGWRHAFSDVMPFSTNAVSGSVPFDIAGVPVSQDVLIVDAGLDISMARNISLGISYNGQFATDAADNGIRGHFSYRF